MVALAGAATAQSGSPQKPADQQSHQGHAMTMRDGDYAPLMSQHHRGGIEMAKMEESSGANAQVKALTTTIRQGQEKDLPEVQAHLWTFVGKLARYALLIWGVQAIWPQNHVRSPIATRALPTASP